MSASDAIIQRNQPDLFHSSSLVCRRRRRISAPMAAFLSPRSPPEMRRFSSSSLKVSRGFNQSERDLEKTERDIRRLIEAIKAGVPGAAVKDEMTTLEARRVDLLGQMKDAPPPMPRLHPNIAEVYRQKVDNLAEALNEERTCLEAAECIRELIEEIRLVPDNGTLRIELYGQLAALITLANGHPRSRGTGVQVTLVAGARSHLYRTRFHYEQTRK